MKNNKQSKMKFTAHGSNTLSAVAKGIAAFIICAVLTLSSFSAVFADSGQISDTVAQTETPCQGISEDEETSQEKVDRLLQISLDLGIKEKRTQQYEESLRENGCLEENVECCAGVLFALNSSHGTKGFKDDKFDRQENSILSRFLSKEEVYEFGKTGKVPEGANFEVVYFKNKNGENTNESAMFYVVGDGVDVELGVNGIENSIVEWEKWGANNFLETTVDNDLRVILHIWAGSGNYYVSKYGDNILFCNYCGDEILSEGGFTAAISTEQFGAQGDSFGAKLERKEVAVLKFRLVIDCCRYMEIKSGKSNFVSRRKAFYEEQYGIYKDKYWEGTAEEFEEFVESAKATGMFTPFVDATWKEIDTLISNNLWLMLQPGTANDEVLEMKERLQELGYFRSGAELSNKYNDTCVERVALFQQVNGLTEAGVVDEQTLALLYSDTAIANQN